MRPTPISIAAILAVALGLAGPVSAQPGPCEQVTAACKNAGFIQGGAGAGTGLKADCVDPIMQGIAQPAGATRPLPQVDPRVVAACKARHPDFGQGKGPTPTADVRHAPTGAAPQLATPVSPGAIASADTTANGSPPAAGGLTAGSGAAKPGLVSEWNPKPGQVWPMTCRIGTENPVSVWGDAGTLSSAAANQAAITIHASKGPAASGLSPGQCAFEDRALKASEPTALCVKTQLISASFQGGRATTVAFTGPAGTLLTSALAGPPKLMNFMVHNGGALNCWVIDKYGP